MQGESNTVKEGWAIAYDTYIIIDKDFEVWTGKGCGDVENVMYGVRTNNK